jgi:hypothetical protein
MALTSQPQAAISRERSSIVHHTPPAHDGAEPQNIRVAKAGIRQHPNRRWRRLNAQIAHLESGPQRARGEKAGIGRRTLRQLNHLARDRPALQVREASST